MTVKVYLWSKLIRYDSTRSLAFMATNKHFYGNNHRKFFQNENSYLSSCLFSQILTQYSLRFLLRFSFLSAQQLSDFFKGVCKSAEKVYFGILGILLHFHRFVLVESEFETCWHSRIQFNFMFNMAARYNGMSNQIV